MASASSKPLGEPGSTGSTFSYAQAAKGRTASTTASTVQSSQATSGTNTPSKDISTSVDVSSGLPNGPKSSDTEKTPSLNGEHGNGLGKSLGQMESATDSKTSHLSTLSSPASPSYITAPTSTLLKEDDTVSSPNLYSESPWDRNSASEVSSDKAAEGSERKKTKKNKKEKAIDKDGDKEKEEIKPEILVAAPPPAVNIWEQRKEAHALKAKVSPQVIESPPVISGESTANGSEVASVVKSTEPKRRGKVLSSDEPDRTTGSTTVKELPTSKSQKRGPDSGIKVKDDAGTRRAPRGSRASEKEDKSLTIQAPPPVEDAISWPTPETALEEEKRKSQEKAEKEEKEDNASNKPREKKEWMKVPFTPSVTFNTPLPSRGRGNRGGGGRGSRESGGRGGHATNGSIGGEKTSSFAAAGVNSSMENRERGRDGGSAARAASLPPNASKRSGDSSNANKDQRKPSVASTFDRTKAEPVGISNKKEPTSTGQLQQLSAGVQNESVSTVSQDSRPQLSEPPKVQKGEQSGDVSSEPQTHGRGGADRRSEPNIRMPDFSKDNAHSQPRERADGRGERGRGNYRGGRGNHASFSNGTQHTPHNYVNGQNTQPSNGYGMRSNTGPYSPPLPQPQYPPTYQQPPSGRNGRVVPSRAQSIPNINPIYARFPPNPQGSVPQMAPIQTAGPMFDYPPNMQSMQSMSAVPFNPYIEQYSVLAMVSMQLEYYFSIDNLCKDVYLRKHMDGQGFVFLSFIASFKRIQSLTADFELLRFACQESEVIEIVVGEDGVDRLRRQDGWEKWVLPVEERDELARHNGPERYYRQMPPQRAPQQMHPRIMLQSGQPMSQPAFSPNGTEPRFQLQVPLAAPIPANGIDSGFVIQTESPLSAAVPDFSPKTSSNSTADKSNENSLDAETTFTDEQVEKLNLVYTQNGQADAKPRAPFHSASSRTFSNGSIDGRSITEELQELEKRSGRSLANGSSNGAEVSPDGLRRSRSPFGMSPTKLVFGNAPPVMWTKDPRVQESVPESTKEESYNVICSRALRHRETSAPGETGYDMRLLYQFWSHFLVRNFNPRMYEEFRRCAFDDSIRRQASFGMISLITYYNEVLNSKKRIIPEIFARHYIELVKAEDPSGDRPGFAKLRASWRNGALDMKSRKKIDNFVDPELRAELEK